MQKDPRAHEYHSKTLEPLDLLQCTVANLQ